MNNAIITKNQEITLENKGVIILKPSDHLATGGEGSVYKPSGNTIVKIYSDPNKMQKDGMAAKVGLLKTLIINSLLHQKVWFIKIKCQLGII